MACAVCVRTLAQIVLETTQFSKCDLWSIHSWRRKDQVYKQCHSSSTPSDATTSKWGWGVGSFLSCSLEIAFEKLAQIVLEATHPVTTKQTPSCKSETKQRSLHHSSKTSAPKEPGTAVSVGTRKRKEKQAKRGLTYLPTSVNPDSRESHLSTRRSQKKEKLGFKLHPCGLQENTNHRNLNKFLHFNGEIKEIANSSYFSRFATDFVYFFYFPIKMQKFV